MLIEMRLEALKHSIFGAWTANLAPGMQSLARRHLAGH
jgi:hypothetical protein